MTVFASDLNNTIIFSAKKKEKYNCTKELICMDSTEEREFAYMTIESYERFRKLIQIVKFIPMTNCSMEQYARTRFFKELPVEYAVITGGGLLLHNKKIDTDWLSKTLELIDPSMDELWKSKRILEKDPNRCFIVKSIDGMITYTRSSNHIETVKRLRDSLDPDKVWINNIGEKIYVLPKELTKGKALQRLRKLMPDEMFYVAGDSSFDVSMLQQADVAIWSGKEDISMLHGFCKKYDINEIDFCEQVIIDILKVSSEKENYCDNDLL